MKIIAALTTFFLCSMGNDEATEVLKKKSAKEEDEEIEEWMKMSDELNWEPRQALVLQFT